MRRIGDRPESQGLGVRLKSPGDDDEVGRVPAPEASALSSRMSTRAPRSPVGALSSTHNARERHVGEHQCNVRQGECGRRECPRRPRLAGELRAEDPHQA